MIIEIEILIKKQIIITKVSHKYILKNSRTNVKEDFHSSYVFMKLKTQIKPVRTSPHAV